MFGEGIGGGGMFLFFIGLIIVWAVMFNGNSGVFGGGNGGGCAEQDNYNNLLRATIDSNANISGSISNLQNSLQSWVGTATQTSIANDNTNTRDILASIANNNKNVADIYFQQLQAKIGEQNAEIQSLKTQNYIDGKFAAQDLANCGIRNQLTAINENMIKSPPFTPLGSYPALSCLQSFPRQGCGCDC